MRFFRFVPVVFVVALSLAGCVSVRSTEQFYEPLTLKKYPPKAKDAAIPVLGAFPKEKYEVIGRLGFSSGRGMAFAKEALVYNARRVGADAVVLLASETTAHQYTYTVPGYTTQQPVTTYSNANATYYGPGGTGFGTASGTSTSYVPVYHPGYTGVGTQMRTMVAGVMIRLVQ